MVIDVHSHVFPRRYLEILGRSRGEVVTRREGSDWVIDYRGLQQFRIREADYDPKRTLEAMDRHRIDVSLISTNIPGPELLEEEFAVDGARAVNDALAEIAETSSGRFAGLACLPWQDPTAALAELNRAAELSGLHGVVIYSHLGGRPVDDECFEPIYARAAELAMPMVFHPTVPTWAEAVKHHSMIPMLAFQVDVSFAALRFILGGVLERNAALRLVLPHAGGVLPYMMGRIDHQTEVMGRARRNISRKPSEYFDRIYLDSVTPSPETLRFALEFCGAERLTFGSDHPWVDMELILRVVRELHLDVDRRKAILGGNARELFRL